jgi:propanediol utilization protein
MSVRHDWGFLKRSYVELTPENPKLAEQMYAIAFRHVLLAERMGYELGVRESMKLSVKHYSDLKALLLDDASADITLVTGFGSTPI